eukprot:g18809.t1
MPCTSMRLQRSCVEAEGLDLCPEAVEVMRLRGVSAKRGSFWKLEKQPQYDTLLMLMNTAGAAGSMVRFKELLEGLHQAMAPDGQVLLDVSPPDWAAVRRARRVSRLQAEDVQNGLWARLDCWLSFGTLQGETFSMIYPEWKAAVKVAEMAGYEASLVYEEPRSRHALLKLRSRAKSLRVGSAGRNQPAPRPQLEEQTTGPQTHCFAKPSLCCIPFCPCCGCACAAGESSSIDVSLWPWGRQRDVTACHVARKTPVHLRKWLEPGQWHTILLMASSPKVKCLAHFRRTSTARRRGRRTAMELSPTIATVLARYPDVTPSSLNFPADAAEWTEKEVDLFIGH